jgi:hypothetical protein
MNSKGQPRTASMGIDLATPVFDASALQRSGWALVPTKNPAEGMRCIAATLGEIIQPERAPAIHQLRATTESEARNGTYSSRFGLGAFPLHTDMANWTTPPRYVLLRHHSGAEDIQTLLFDSGVLIEALGSDLFRQGVWSARGPRGRFLCNVLSRRRGRQLFRWDVQALTPQTLEAQRASDAIGSYLNQTADRDIVPVKLGGREVVLVLDNWRIMHARPSVPSSSASRTLERIFVGEVF